MACSGTSGTKLILDKAQELTKQGKNFRFILAFDFYRNNAGQIASTRALESILRAGYAVCSDIQKHPILTELMILIKKLQQLMMTTEQTKLNAKKVCFIPPAFV